MNQGRTLIDTGWTLALVYVAYIIASLSMHLTGWTMVASQTGIHRDGQFAVAALFVTTIGVAVLSSYITPRAIEGLAARLSWRFASLPLFTKVVVLLFLAATAPVAIAYFVLDRFPNSGDEFAYLFQGTLFAKGHLWASAPPLGDAFVPYRTWVSGDKWLSQYPPGWPLALALALVAGIPVWSLNGLLGAATVAALMSPLWQFPNRGLALVAAGVYVLTPFYLLNAASYHSHVLTALLILLLCLCCLWYQRNRRMLALVAGGALLGLIGVTRYFALILVLPALCYWLIRETHHARIRMIAVLALAGMPFLCLLLLYQYFITGNPFRSTYALVTVKDVEMSFALKDILHGAKLTIYRLVEARGLGFSCPHAGVFLLRHQQNQVPLACLLRCGLSVLYRWVCLLRHDGGKSLRAAILFRGFPVDAGDDRVERTASCCSGTRSAQSPTGVQWIAGWCGLSPDIMAVRVHRVS